MVFTRTQSGKAWLVSLLEPDHYLIIIIIINVAAGQKLTKSVFVTKEKMQKHGKHYPFKHV